MENNIQRENMLKVGTTLSNGKYRIDQYLASGGFGNTYVATNLTFDEKVAIKELFIKGVCGRNTDKTEISVSLTENQRAFSAQQDKFRKEARRLRKLSNPHIVGVHDLFDENGTSYYVMDFVEGESLSARMKRTKKPLSESELMLILPQILDALECVHNEGIWHLDLKPANIMIDAKGNVHLIDFGASKQLRNANGDSLSTSSAMTYTPGYASSEQMEQNIEKFGPWTDLYAFGATMYNLLTMQQPPSPSDIDEDSRTALKLPSHISKKTEKLIVWLMKPNRTMRPKSVMDVRQFLAEANQDIPSKKSTTDLDDGEDDTLVNNKKNEEPQNVITSEKTYNSTIKTIAIAAIAIICLGGIFVAKQYRNNIDDEYSTAKVAFKNVTDQPISVKSGPNNMRQYLFTGELADTLGALPNGKGIAKFEKYENIPASTYEGEFVNGICEDSTGVATMTFVSGDRYIGTFKNGYYEEGKYIMPDNSYFVGTFKNGSPYNGKWYTSKGTPDGDVVNGMDQ
ncbi:MAG: protein kinase [Bacteroidaceae bacterium]|nr:protein kinase [Bacteroidaceae bacterium]